VSSKKAKKENKNAKAETGTKGEAEKIEEKGGTEQKEIEVVEQAEEEKKDETQLDILKERLKESENQAKELEDRLLRVAADFDNFKKRTAREFENLVKFANESLITKLTDTLDNFERALDHARNSTDFDNLHQGVKLIYESLKDVLEKQGLKPIKTVGEKFDPNFHEAISQKESDEYPEGIIVDEISKGYILNNRVIKAPKVIVSMGSQKENEEKADKGEAPNAEQKEPEKENKQGSQEND
jgi:molecular chaperone GrpE